MKGFSPARQLVSPWEDQVRWLFVLVVQEGQVLREMEEELEVAWSLLADAGSDVDFCIESCFKTVCRFCTYVGYAQFFLGEWRKSRGL